MAIASPDAAGFDTSRDVEVESRPTASLYGELADPATVDPEPAVKTAASCNGLGDAANAAWQVTVALWLVVEGRRRARESERLRRAYIEGLAPLRRLRARRP